MDYCVCCGNYVPEGTMICYLCKKKYLDTCNKKRKKYNTMKYFYVGPGRRNSGLS